MNESIVVKTHPPLRLKDSLYGMWNSTSDMENAHCDADSAL